MMTAKLLILITVLSSLTLAGAAPKGKESAQTFYDRGMAVLEVDQPASMGLFTKAAKMGHVDAMVRLAHCYQTGTNPSYKHALLWYEKAVEAGNTAAIFEVGSIYEKGGRSIKPDVAEAIKWYEKGVSNNSLKSCEALARIYASCPEPEYHDGPKAIQFATLLVQKEKNNPAGFDLLAAAFARDINFPEALKAASTAITLSSLEEAPARRERRAAYEQGMPYPAIASNDWILTATEKGNIWAILKLANQYGDELSDSYEPALARNWYQRAAEDGNPEALIELGHMCFRGQGGEVDMKKAFWCYSEAADAEVVSAYAPLARMYLGGRGTGQDFEKAMEWYEKAVDAGQRQNSMAINALKIGERKPEMRDPEKLFSAANTLVANNEPNAKGELPTYTKKTPIVYMHYWLAAEQGHLQAIKELADMHFYGKRYFVRDGEIDKTTGGINNNYAKALDYYQQLNRRNIEIPEMETCKELYLIELKDRRERLAKKTREDSRRAGTRAKKGKGTKGDQS